MAKKNAIFPNYKTTSMIPISLMEVNSNFGSITSEVHTISIGHSFIKQLMNGFAKEEKQNFLASLAKLFKEQNGTIDFEKSESRIHKLGIIQVASLIEHTITNLIDELTEAYKITNWEKKDPRGKKLNILIQVPYNLRKVDRHLADKIEKLPEFEFVLHYIFFRNCLIHDEISAENAKSLKKGAEKIQKDHAKHFEGYNLKNALVDPSSANIDDFLILIRSFKNFRTQLPNCFDLNENQYARLITSKAEFKEFAKLNLTKKIINIKTGKEDDRTPENSVKYINKAKLRAFVFHFTRGCNIQHANIEKIFEELTHYHFKVQSNEFSW